MKKKGPDPVRNVYMLEIIGSRMRVLDHSDPNLKEREGIVVDETRNTFLVDVNEKRCVIPKKSGKFEIAVEDGGKVVPVIIDGNSLLYRPEDRTKRCERKRPISRRNVS